MKRRPIRVEGNIAYVPLTRGYEAIIDVDDVPLVEKWNWGAIVRGHLVYAGRTCRSGPVRRTVLLHRALMGEPVGMDVDHVSGDGLDNRRINVRVATRSQNAQNQRRRADNKSGFKGVHARYGKWVAQICSNGANISLGYFSDKAAAHAAYCKASAELHGEFGRVG